MLVEDVGQSYLAEPDAVGDEARTLRPLQATAVTYRIAFGPRAGQKVLTLRGAMLREAAVRQPMCADVDGNSAACRGAGGSTRPQAAGTAVQLHHPACAVGRTGAAQRCRAGGVKLKTRWRDGTTHVVMSPLEFMQRLAALVPRPRLHLIRFHGVLAPNATLRALVAPQGPKQPARVTEAATVAECEVEHARALPGRISWARLLKSVFDIDMHHCPNCGAGELKIIAAILERQVLEKILTHLCLDPKPPSKGRAREGCTSLPEPRRPSETHRHRLQRQTAAGVALRAVSARGCRSQGQS